MNYYQILGVPEDATIDEIKQKYKVLIKTYHPDLYKGDKEFANEKTKEITEAYKVLVDPYARDEYDHTLHSDPISYTTDNYYENNNDVIYADEPTYDYYYDEPNNNSKNNSDKNKPHEPSATDKILEKYDKVATDSINAIINIKGWGQVVIIITLILLAFIFMVSQFQIINVMLSKKRSEELDREIRKQTNQSKKYTPSNEIQEIIVKISDISDEQLVKDFGPDILKLVENGTFANTDELKLFLYSMKDNY